jgi:hypothetical protein
MSVKLKMAKIGITGHSDEEIASMTPEQQARCFVDTDEAAKSKSEEKPHKKK